MIDPKIIRDICYNENAEQYYQIIAQHDDEDYNESGWVCVYDLKDDKYALGHYSHCSCFGTWEALEDGWNWEGSLQELLGLANNMLDPDMPERKISPEDYDLDHLTAVYQQIIQWQKEKA